MPWHCFWWSVVVIGRAARDTTLHPTLMPVAEHLQWACTSKFEYITTPFAQHAATGTVSLLGGNEGGLTLSKEAIEVVLRSVHFYFDHYGAHPNSKLWSRLPAAKATPKLKLVLDMVIAVSGNEMCARCNFPAPLSLRAFVAASSNCVVLLVAIVL